MTYRIWPSGCVCQFVRAPGSKSTRKTPASGGEVGAASIHTAPVNHSSGPRRTSSMSSAETTFTTASLLCIEVQAGISHTRLASAYDRDSTTTTLLHQLTCNTAEA